MPSFKLNPFSIAKKGLDFPLGGDVNSGGWSGSGGYGPWIIGQPFPSSRINYAVEAGDPTENGIVMASINWITRTFPQAPFRVVTLSEDQDASLVEEIADHPLTLLLKRPNPYYPGRLLWAATLLSYWVDGNAYWLKARDNGNRVQQLWYEPHYTIRPHWPRDGSKFIDGYQICRGGQWKPELIPVEDVVHFRNGLDPKNPRMGLSPLKPVLREIFSDNEAANFTAALLRNRGIPGLVLSPKPTNGMPGLIEDPEGLKNTIMAKTVGDRRGEPLILQGPTQVDQIAFDPKAMQLDKVRGIPEFRVSSVIGVPAVVAGLGASWTNSTYANMAEAKATAWEENILPTQDIITATMDVQLLPDFTDDPAEICDFDTRNVPALAEDQDALYKRVTEAYNGGWMLRMTALQQAGLPFDEARDNVYRTDLPLISERLEEQETAPEGDEDLIEGIEDDDEAGSQEGDDNDDDENPED